MNTTKKDMVFLPGDEPNVKVHFTCKKTTVLRIEIIEIDNPNKDDVFVDFDL